MPNKILTGKRIARNAKGLRKNTYTRRYTTFPIPSARRLTMKSVLWLRLLSAVFPIQKMTIKFAMKGIVSIIDTVNKVVPVKS